jgi:SRSO17 transposase
VPDDVGFEKKWEIALQEVDELLADDLPWAPVVADAGYGVATEFREALSERGLLYAVGISEEVTVWPEGSEPLPPKPRRAHHAGRPPKLLRRDAAHRPVSVQDLAHQLAKSAWKNVRWREGTRGTMRSRFAAVRVRPAHRDYWRSDLRDPEWLLIEWPPGEKEPTKYWLSTISERAAIEDLVRLVKIRWRIERDYQEMKDEIGLDHYEGRSWQGFHHHGVLCIAAYAFLAAERARLPPLRLSPSSNPLPYPKVSAHGALPVRTERHNPSSITTMRWQHIRAIIPALPNCPWCGIDGVGHFMTQ